MIKHLTVVAFFTTLAAPSFAQADRLLACIKELRLTYAKSRQIQMARPVGGWEALRPSAKAEISKKAQEDARTLISVSGADRNYVVCLTALNNVRTECEADKTC